MKKTLLSNFSETLLTLCVVLALSAGVQAQSQIPCGTIHDSESFVQMKNRAWENRQIMDENRANAAERDDDIIYIPVKYHLYARADTVGLPRFSDILEMHCVLNEEYAEHEIQFYINDGFEIYYNDDWYQNPGDFPFHQNNVRSNNSVNIFIGNTANIGNSIGTTLGYYSPQDDWVVLRKSVATATGNTLPHEIGHFLSLNHPFLGWDCTFYEEYLDENPGAECAPSTAPCFPIPVERANGSNCATAGDFLCDTPADYNLGFQAGGCAYNGNACDPQGNPVEPMENNIMSYFDGCADFVFTPDQVEMMLTDYNSSSRNYLRSDGGPTTTEEAGEIPAIVAPEVGETLDHLNVTVQWEAADNAEMYVVQYALNPGFSLLPGQVITSSTAAVLNDLLPNQTYFWRVSPYNEYVTCLNWSEVGEFQAGSEISAVRTIEAATEFSVQPNPVEKGGNLLLNITATTAFVADLQIISAAGTPVETQTQLNVNVGENTLRIQNSDLPAGLYFAVLRSENEISNRKFVVTE